MIEKVEQLEHQISWWLAEASRLRRDGNLQQALAALKARHGLCVDSYVASHGFRPSWASQPISAGPNYAGVLRR